MTEYLVIPKFREGIDNDTEDDVETNGCDDDEERYIKQGFPQMEREGLSLWYLQELRRKQYSLYRF